MAMIEPIARGANRYIPLRRSLAAVGALLLLGAAAPPPAPPQFAHWIDGTTSGEPETQVQTIDADTFVIR